MALPQCVVFLHWLEHEFLRSIAQDRFVVEVPIESIEIFDRRIDTTGTARCGHVDETARFESVGVRTANVSTGTFAMAGVDGLLTVAFVARVLHCTRLENELSKVGFVGFAAHMFDQPAQENELQARFEIVRRTLFIAHVRVRVAVFGSRLEFQRFIFEKIDQLIVRQILLTYLLEDLHFRVVLNAGRVRE